MRSRRETRRRCLRVLPATRRRYRRQFGAAINNLTTGHCFHSSLEKRWRIQDSNLIKPTFRKMSFHWRNAPWITFYRSRCAGEGDTFCEPSVLTS